MAAVVRCCSLRVSAALKAEVSTQPCTSGDTQQCPQKRVHNGQLSCQVLRLRDECLCPLSPGDGIVSALKVSLCNSFSLHLW